MDGQADRVPLVRTPEELHEDELFYSVYGAWVPMDPPTFAREMAGFERPWWVIGGSAPSGEVAPWIGSSISR